VLGCVRGRDGRLHQEEWVEGTAEARPWLSNSRAKNRLVSLTTAMKSAHLLLGVGFCVSVESSGTWGQERQSFLYQCSKPFLKMSQPLL
jgi:hypothetical protein